MRLWDNFKANASQPGGFAANPLFMGGLRALSADMNGGDAAAALQDGMAQVEALKAGRAQQEMDAQKFALVQQQMQQDEADAQAMRDFWNSAEGLRARAEAGVPEGMPVGPGMALFMRTASAAPSQPPSAVREYEYAKGQHMAAGGDPDVFPSFTDWKRANSKSGANNVSVNTGGLFKLPAGFMLSNPENPGEGVVPIPGGDKDPQVQAAGEARNVRKEARARYDEAKPHYDVALRFLKDVEEFGIENLPTEARGRMSTGYLGMMAAISALGNMGVLQPGEVAVIRQALPDPTTWSSRVTDTLSLGGTTDQIRGAARDVIRRLKTRMDEAQQRINESSSSLPVGGGSDMERRAIKLREDLLGG